MRNNTQHIFRAPYTNAPELTHMLTESKYLGKEKVRSSLCLFPIKLSTQGGLLRPCDAWSSSAEAPLPQRLAHLDIRKDTCLWDPHAGRGQAALGEDQEEEGGHRHAHQWKEEGQAQLGLKGLVRFMLCPYLFLFMRYKHFNVKTLYKNSYAFCEIFPLWFSIRNDGNNRYA